MECDLSDGFEFEGTLAKLTRMFRRVRQECGMKALGLGIGVVVVGAHKFSGWVDADAFSSSSR